MNFRKDLSLCLEKLMETPLFVGKYSPKRRLRDLAGMTKLLAKVGQPNKLLLEALAEVTASFESQRQFRLTQRSD